MDFKSERNIRSIPAPEIFYLLKFFCKNLFETEESHKPYTADTIGLAVLFVWCVLSFLGISTFLYFHF